MEIGAENLSIRAVAEELKIDRKQIEKLTSNTFRIACPDGGHIIRYHHTDIINVLPDQTIVLNSGGWKTRTTKDRINEFAPIKNLVSQSNGIWYVRDYVFQDNISILSTGEVVNHGGDFQKIKRQLSAIRKYVADYIAGLDKMGIPGAGDCLVCQMEQDSPDHIQLHIEENYLVPRLIYNALKYAKAGQLIFFAVHATQSGTAETYYISLARDYGKRALTRYIKHCLGFAS